MPCQELLQNELGRIFSKTVQRRLAQQPYSSSGLFFRRLWPMPLF